MLAFGEHAYAMLGMRVLVAASPRAGRGTCPHATCLTVRATGPATDFAEYVTRKLAAASDFPGRGTRLPSFKHPSISEAMLL